MSHLTYTDARVRQEELLRDSARRQRILDYRRAHRLTARARLADLLRALAVRLDHDHPRGSGSTQQRPSLRQLVAR